MKPDKRNIIVIPADPEHAARVPARRQLRVAAYCRVSTEDEEQKSSYESQKSYYTDLIMKNPEWQLAGIFADEGITGTSARKRPEFLKMIRLCQLHRIDMILVKSISRFSRNTVDCLHYTRLLKSLGIPIFFEKENFGTMDQDSELRITMMGAFAQAESESISENVRWGIRKAMEKGKTCFHYEKLYGFCRGPDGKPDHVPGEAEVVEEIYRLYLLGGSLQSIADQLNAEGHMRRSGQPWISRAVRSILQNEKYCGDLLLQKTFVQDCISKKAVKNTGQLPMIMVQNNHPGIVSHRTFHLAQAETARRAALKSPSRKALSGHGTYSSRYALTERLVCGECGTLYRRCVWTQSGRKRPVWRCMNRLDYGTKYCRHSPTLDEEPLHQAILAAVNRQLERRTDLAQRVCTLAPDADPDAVPGIAELDRQLEFMNSRFQALLARAAREGLSAYTEEFEALSGQITALKTQRNKLLTQHRSEDAAAERTSIADELFRSANHLTEWDDSLMRQLLDTVTVLSEDELLIRLYDGTEVSAEICRE